MTKVYLLRPKSDALNDAEIRTPEVIDLNAIKKQV